MSQKTVLITGANRGLGAALAKEAHDQGCSVIGTARDASTLLSDPFHRTYALDLSRQSSIDGVCSQLLAEGQKIDLLINNAGFNPKDRKDDPDYFQSTFTIKHFDAANVADSLWINALAPIALVSRLLPILSDEAVVLNISSWLGSIGNKTSGGHYGYAGSKALLNMFTRAAALEFVDTDRSAVALNPGWMRTDMGGSRADKAPEDVAQAVFALWKDGTLSASNGHFLNTDGSDHPW